MRKGDPYKILGLQFGATDDMIRAAYRRGCLNLHPDTTKTKDASAFIQLKEAYEFLRSPVHREEYDRVRARDDNRQRRQPNPSSDKPDHSSDTKRPSKHDVAEGQPSSSAVRPESPNARQHLAVRVRRWFQSVLILLASIGFLLAIAVIIAAIPLAIWFGLHVANIGEGGNWISGTLCGVLSLVPILGIAALIFAIAGGLAGGLITIDQNPSRSERPIPQEKRADVSGRRPPPPDRQWFRSASDFARKSGRPHYSDAKAGSRDDSRKMEDQLIQLVIDGEMLAAIRLARQLYGLGLAEAKKFVDDLAR